MELFDIYFTGKLVDGVETDQAKQNFAGLFKMPPNQIAKLFNGKPQLLKRGVTKTEAIKYKGALHKAGLLVAFKAHKNEAERPPSAPETPDNDNGKTEGTLTLAPVGSDVLRENEKRVFQDADIDTSGIQLTSPFTPVETQERPVPAAPDISHISAAPVGEDLIVDKPEPAPPPALDLEQFTVAEPGVDLEQLKEDKVLLDPDISHISVAEPGADILPDKKEDTPPPAPDISHLSLTNNNNS